MFSHLFPRAVVATLIAVFAMSSGCGGDARWPSAPSAAAVPPPSILAVSPNRGSTGGGTSVAITGSGFQSGAMVRLGRDWQTAQVLSNTLIHLTTTARDPGTVEIVVTNRDGQAARLGDGYSYASPHSFDFNGTWEGLAAAHPDHLGPTRYSDMGMRFTIEGNVLTSFTCGGAALAFPSQLVVSDGAFSHAGNGEVVMSGRIVAGACPATRWTAARR
jgi:IPT/TIG domain